MIEPRLPLARRVETALQEIKNLIGDRYPDATFDVADGEDPGSAYLTATVDVEDMGPVVDVFLDRLVEIQVDEELPVFVLLARPQERNAAILRRTDPSAAALMVL
jgi:hypothetical protein